MYLLDTNVLSELRRGPRADENVRRWVSGIAELQTYISVVSLMELEIGVRLKERTDPHQGAILRQWLSTVRMRFANRTLDVDTAVASRCAQLHVPDRRPADDAYIAATALAHGLKVVTRNVADFAPMGVPLLNPWEPS